MTFTPKYHLTGETRWLSNGVRLSRLIAARSFGSVKKGDRGGWVESPENLSHEGNCWIAGDAAVWGYATVGDDALVQDRAEVHGHCHIFGSASVGDRADLADRVYVYDSAVIGGFSRLRGHCVICQRGQVICQRLEPGTSRAHIEGDAIIRGRALVCGRAWVRGFAVIEGEARVCESARVWDNTLIWGSPVIRGGALIGDDAHIMGSACIEDAARVVGAARVGGKTTLCGRSFVTGGAMLFSGETIRDEVISGEGLRAAALRPPRGVRAARSGDARKQ